MKKQLLKTSFCLAALALANTLTAQVALVEAPGGESQDVARISTVGNKLFFTGREQGGSIFDVYLWSNDGTTSTRLLSLSQITQNINPSYFVPCNGKAFFFYSDGVSASGYEPWVSDGTVAGTFMIKDINPGAYNSVLGNGLQSCTCYNNKIYFGADNGTNGNELWVSDGTAAGTTLVKDIKPGSASGAIGGMVNYKNELYFTAKSNNYLELWHTDGTTAGTVKVNSPSTLRGYQSDVVVHDTLLYFSGQDNSTSDFGIWKTNGTTLGTTAVPGSLPSTPLVALGPIISSGSEVFFGYQYYSAGYAYRLYKTDGTSITLVKDSVNFKNPVKLGNKLVFKGEVTGSATNGEPWVTDGTTAGTFKLNPISWMTAGTFRNNSEAFNNKIYFASGTTLWETDGTVGGTLQTAAGTGNVLDFAEMNGTLYFNAQNPANSNRAELFKLGTSTGIKESNEAVPGLDLYPQPASDRVTLWFESKENVIDIDLMDITGKLVMTEKLLLTDNMAELNLTTIANGIYLLQVKTGSGRSTAKKIVVAH